MKTKKSWVLKRISTALSCWLLLDAHQALTHQVLTCHQGTSSVPVSPPVEIEAAGRTEEEFDPFCPLIVLFVC